MGGCCAKSKAAFGRKKEGTESGAEKGKKGAPVAPELHQQKTAEGYIVFAPEDPMNPLTDSTPPISIEASTPNTHTPSSPHPGPHPSTPTSPHPSTPPSFKHSLTKGRGSVYAAGELAGLNWALTSSETDLETQGTEKSCDLCQEMGRVEGCPVCRKDLCEGCFTRLLRPFCPFCRARLAASPVVRSVFPINAADYATSHIVDSLELMGLRYTSSFSTSDTTSYYSPISDHNLIDNSSISDINLPNPVSSQYLFPTLTPYHPNSD